MDGPITLTTIRAEIHRHKFGNADEFELHQGLDTILSGLGLPVEREVRLDEHNRIDIAVDLPGGTRLGIEVKVAGRGRDVLGQIRRYTKTGQLDAVMLVTTIARHTREVVWLGDALG